MKQLIGLFLLFALTLALTACHPRFSIDPPLIVKGTTYRIWKLEGNKYLILALDSRAKDEAAKSICAGKICTAPIEVAHYSIIEELNPPK